MDLAFSSVSKQKHLVLSEITIWLLIFRAVYAQYSTFKVNVAPSNISMTNGSSKGAEALISVRIYSTTNGIKDM